MTAGVHNFTIKQGETWRRVVTIRDQSDDPINLTGFTAQMQIRKDVEASGDPLLELTTENGGLTLGGVLGTVSMLLSSTATESLTKPGVYDLEITSGSGEVTYPLEGQIKLKKSVTHE